MDAMDSERKMLLVDPAGSHSMQYAKKMLLVDPTRKPTITEKKLSALDEEINTTLHSDIPDDEKAKRYLSTLHKYKYFDDRQPKRIDGEKAILESLEPQQRSDAKKLLELINPHVSWSDDGELVYKSSVIPHSNITELLRDVLKPPKSGDPAGWEEFSDALRETQVPVPLIRNPKRRRQVYPAHTRGKKKSPVYSTPSDGRSTRQKKAKWVGEDDE